MNISPKNVVFDSTYVRTNARRWGPVKPKTLPTSGSCAAGLVVMSLLLGGIAICRSSVEEASMDSWRAGDVCPVNQSATVRPRRCRAASAHTSPCAPDGVGVFHDAHGGAELVKVSEAIRFRYRRGLGCTGGTFCSVRPGIGHAKRARRAWSFNSSA